MKSRAVSGRLTRAKRPPAPAPEVDTSGMAPPEIVRHFIAQSGGLGRALKKLGPMKPLLQLPLPTVVPATLHASPFEPTSGKEQEKAAAPSRPDTPGQQWREELLRYKPRDAAACCDDGIRYRTIHDYDPLERAIHEMDDS